MNPAKRRDFFVPFLHFVGLVVFPEKVRLNRIPGTKKEPGSRRTPTGILILFITLFLRLVESGSLSLQRIQDLLADTQMLRRNLQQLIRINELQCLLQAHYLGRRQLQRVIGTGSTGIRQLLASCTH